MFANYKKTKCFSEQTISDHLKLLDGYSKNAETLAKKLKNVDRKVVNATNSDYRLLADSLRFNYNAQLLHQMYFTQIGSETSSADDRKAFKNWLEDSAANTGTKLFASFDKWKEDLFASAKASRGWVVFGFDPFQGQFKNAVVDSHDVGLAPGFFPILVLDVWEHAYIGDFGTNREKYVKEWFSYINWASLEPTMRIVNSLHAAAQSEDLLRSITASVYSKLDTLNLLEG